MVVFYIHQNGEQHGNAPTNFAIDSVKYDYVKNNSVYDTVTE